MLSRISSNLAVLEPKSYYAKGSVAFRRLTLFGNSKVVNLFSGASDSNRRVSERTNETILAVVQLPIGANTVEARRNPRDSNLEDLIYVQSARHRTCRSAGGSYLEFSAVALLLHLNDRETVWRFALWHVEVEGWRSIFDLKRGVFSRDLPFASYF